MIPDAIVKIFAFVLFTILIVFFIAIFLMLLVLPFIATAWLTFGVVWLIKAKPSRTRTTLLILGLPLLIVALSGILWVFFNFTRVIITGR
ncbi:MAG: hypothetical protein HXX08_08965 [Chloroflexi bacterium]|uniref:Uncharacterized protein n=1 Tax=Candidatus Chlorohelix allophototropha TaxID=3003348 RepID=A0A8T7LVE1_9CHLR|nr:hypothetical protein [Chloroflexota bacterium]WJW67854.1 hypothetical protein OZ401_001137 [Chloroflexota bacterium L227-S17]